jgi:hypothetical protein
MTFGTWRWWGRQPHAPAAFISRKYSWYSFSLGAESTPGLWYKRKEKFSGTTGNRSREVNTARIIQSMVLDVMPLRVFDRFKPFRGTCCNLIHLTSCSTSFLPTDKLAPFMPTGYTGSRIDPFPILFIMYHFPRQFNSSTMKMEAFVFSEIYLSKCQKTHTKRQHTFLEMLIRDFNIGTNLNVFIYFQRSGDQANRCSKPYKKECLASSFWRQSLRDIDWHNNRHCYNIPLSSGNGFAAVHMYSRVGTRMVDSK